MKHDNKLYQPQRSMDDVRVAPSYYHAADIQASPFTRIGDISDGGTTAHSSTELVKSAPHFTKIPVFPAGFSLTRENSSRRPQTKRISYQPTTQPLRQSPFKRWFSWTALSGLFVAMVDSFKRLPSEISLAPQPIYQAETGTKRHWSNLTKRFSEATAPLIVLAGIAALFVASTTPMNPLVAHSRAKNAKPETTQASLVNATSDQNTGSISSGAAIPTAATNTAGNIQMSPSAPSQVSQVTAIIPPVSDPTTPVTGGTGGDNPLPVDPGTGGTTPPDGGGSTGDPGTGGTTGDGGTGGGGILPPVTDPLPITVPLLSGDTSLQPVISIDPVTGPVTLSL